MGENPLGGAAGIAGALVLDADGLNLLAEAPVYREDWILTPHPGEAARLLACTVAEVEQDRLLAVRRLQQQYGGVVLLKGADIGDNCVIGAGCIGLCAGAGHRAAASGRTAARRRTRLAGPGQ